MHTGSISSMQQHPHHAPCVRRQLHNLVHDVVVQLLRWHEAHHTTVKALAVAKCSAETRAAKDHIHVPHDKNVRVNEDHCTNEDTVQSQAAYYD